MLSSAPVSHRDLKLLNIGWVGSRAVLLDLDGAVKLGPTRRKIAPVTDGHGTRHYLAPECEMQAYYESVHIWSMGPVLFQVIFGYQPLPFYTNPWRPGNEYRRSQFHKSCAKMVKLKLQNGPKIKECRYFFQLRFVKRRLGAPC